MARDYRDPDTWWGEYRQYYAGRSWRDYRFLLAEAITHALEGPLLDIGSGYGFLIECARHFGIAAIGVEASAEAVAVCRERHPLVDVRVWWAGTDLPVDSSSIGVAMANEFVDHITPEQNSHMFKQIYRVLKPDGILIVKSPSRYNLIDQDLGHVSFFSPSEFRRFVRSFSFKILSQPYVPQPLLGRTPVGLFAMRMVSKAYRPDKWAARIDLVAQKTLPGSSGRPGEAEILEVVER